ncbi:MAG: IucA/IucC family protein, partial [Actinomycetota bacterium]|nr:IucA/IucC family protein [Actinomycetota bacterium]
MSAAVQAEAAAVQRLLNAYLRETGIALDPVRSTSAAPDPQAMTVALPRTRAWLAVLPTSLSPTGHHRFSPSWWSSFGDGWQPVTGTRVIDLLVSEVAAADGDEDRRTARRERLLSQISDSVARTTYFLTAELSGRVRPPVPGSADAFIAAEQALRTGHPFHPTPKSAQGLDGGDVERFAPELGVAFRLHWLAVDPELAATVTIDESADLPPLESVRPEALARLGGRRDEWPLLPVHPWQAAHLARLPQVECLLQEGRLVVLGPLGPIVRPTSSVRTVWDASSQCFLKLPFAVRVTNFVRVNPPEQLARSLHASAVLARLLPHLSLDRLTVLLERGYRGVRPRTLDHEAAQDLLAHTAVVVRDGPDLSRGSPMVVAALLEPSACSGVTPLDRAL